MEALLATREETELINKQRKQVAGAMAGQKQLAVPGPCSPDMNRLPNGELAAVHHVKRMAEVGKTATGSLIVVRYVAEKPRTRIGPTGIIHAPGGAKAYLEGARQLHDTGVLFASEVMSDAGAAIVVPRLATGWVGTREVSATGPRYNVRPTDRDLERDIHPLPTWVKNDQSGSLRHTFNAIHTIRHDAPETRVRFGMNGLEEVTTFGNPYVGVILRGQDKRPNGDLSEILAEEIETAREQLGEEFGEDVIPILVDVSHAHAKYEGGGEEGQLRVATALAMLQPVARVNGWMAETYIHAGNQPASGTVPGLSITDQCIGQARAEQLLVDMDTAFALSQPVLASI